jgi:hypothetical protein
MSANTERSIPSEGVIKELDNSVNSDLLDKTCVYLENVEKPMI